jgi:hypothetical protein
VEEPIREPAMTNQRRDVLARGLVQDGMQNSDQHLTNRYQAAVILVDVTRCGATNPADFERALNLEWASSRGSCLRAPGKVPPKAKSPLRPWWLKRTLLLRG